MRLALACTLVLLLSTAPAIGADAKDCLDLTAKIDNDVTSPSGIRVTVSGHNRCSEDLDGSSARFRVLAIGAAGTAIATQYGRFGGTVAAHGRAETKVFVSCDPDRVRSVRVEAR